MTQAPPFPTPLLLVSGSRAAMSPANLKSAVSQIIRQVEGVRTASIQIPTLLDQASLARIVITWESHMSGSDYFWNTLKKGEYTDRAAREIMYILSQYHLRSTPVCQEGFVYRRDIPPNTSTAKIPSSIVVLSGNHTNTSPQILAALALDITTTFKKIATMKAFAPAGPRNHHLSMCNLEMSFLTSLEGADLVGQHENIFAHLKSAGYRHALVAAPATTKILSK